MERHTSQLQGGTTPSRQLRPITAGRKVGGESALSRYAAPEFKSEYVWRGKDNPLALKLSIQLELQGVS